MNASTVDILLVEDSSADAEMTMRTLKRSGFVASIEWVRDGVEALEYLFCEGDRSSRTPGNPKLVLLDLQMPRLDGLRALERIKQDPRTRTIPVVMMTSSREESDLLQSYALGVNSFVVKPVGSAEFVQTVTQLGMYWMLANQTPA